MGKYNLSKLGKLLYKVDDANMTFIPVNDLNKKFSTNLKSNEWKLMCRERFVAMNTDTLLYLYDLENDFVCKKIPSKNAHIIWGESENDKYFAIRDNSSNTKIYVLPDLTELVFDKPLIVCGFANNQVISYKPDWEQGETYLMNIDEFFETTTSYHGIFSCLSFDQSSIMFTTDSQNIYWWSLEEGNSSKGFFPRSIFKLSDNTTYSSQKFSVLRNANKQVLKFLNDYNIPSEFGIPIGETNHCLVFSNDNAHVTRIINLSELNSAPLTINKAWPEMIFSDNHTYLQICNSEHKWQSDSTSIYYGQKLIVTNHYNGLHISSDYAITGDWAGEKLFTQLNAENGTKRSIFLEGYLPGQLSIMNGWLFAAWGKNLKVYNFLTIEELIRECSLYSNKQKEKIIEILKSSNHKD